MFFQRLTSLAVVLLLSVATAHANRPAKVRKAPTQAKRTVPKRTPAVTGKWKMTERGLTLVWQPAKGDKKPAPQTKPPRTAPDKSSGVKNQTAKTASRSPAMVGAAILAALFEADSDSD